MFCCLHNRNNDNEDDDEEGNSNDKAHFHVFPPHILPDPIGIASEALSGYSKIVSLILQRVKSLLTLYNLGNVVSHDGDSVINLCLDGSSLGIWPRASAGSRGIG